MSRVKLVGIAAAVALIGLSSPGYALTFTFSFTNTTGVSAGFVPGTVTGEIFGLADNATSSATDVTITSYPANTSTTGFTFPTPPLDLFASPWTVNLNQFTVSGGEITAFEFLASGISNNTAYVIPNGNSSDFSFQLCDSFHSFVCGLNASGFNFTGGVLTQYQFSTLIEGQAYSPDVTFNSVLTVTPLPAAFSLFATGLGALGLLGWRRKRNNAAAPAAA